MRPLQDHSTHTDAQLLTAASRDRDTAAFGELYRRHAGQVHAYLGRRLPGAASDLAAETFAQAWLSRRRFRDDHAGSALPWLIGIARNCLRESIRRDRVETRARERLGLPVTLAEDDGYETVVEAPLAPHGAATGARPAARARAPRPGTARDRRTSLP